MVAMNDAEEITNRRCWWPSPRHGQGDWKKDVFRSDTDSNHLVERLEDTKAKEYILPSS